MKKRNITLLTAIAAAAAFAPTAQAGITLLDNYTGAYRIAFNTTGQYTAASSTITDYDALVEAEAAGTSGAAIDISDITGWKVIGSTVAVNARVNTDTVGSGGANDVPIYNVNGVRIADGNTHLWNTEFGFQDGSLTREEHLGGFWRTTTPTDHYAFIDHVNGASGSFGNRTWTGTLAGGATNTGSELGASTVGQADNRQLGADWSTWGSNGNPNPNTHPYLLYGISGVIGTTTPAADLEITSISYDQVSEQVTLTWTSSPNRTYAVFFSDDLNFDTDVDDSVVSAGDTTSLTFSNPAPGARKVFFRISESGP